MVEDGRPFCPHCRAPQIQVQIAAPSSETAAEPIVENPQSMDFGRTSNLPPAFMDRNASGRAALKAGVLGVFLGMIPILGVVLTGSLAAYLYKRDKGAAPSARVAARLGAAAGVVAFAINSLLIAIRIFAMHAGQEYMDGIIKMAQTFGYNTADPDIQAAIHSLFTPAGLAATFFFGMIFAIFLSAIGGAVMAFVLRPTPRA